MPSSLPYFAPTKSNYMARILAILFFAALLVACNSATNETKKDTGQPGVTPATPPPSLEPFADSLVRLDEYAEETIEKAAGYYQRLVPADTVLADSAAVLLLGRMRRVVDSLNEKMYRDTADYFNLAYGEEPLSEKEKAFKRRLASHHLRIHGDGEGGALILLDYDWLNGIVQPKTSTAADEYLSLLAAEESNPALLDAGLAIGMNELVQRVITSEQLMDKSLPHAFAQNNTQRNKFYTDVLLVGSSNSPSVEDEAKLTLVPEVKQAYENLLRNYPSSKAAQHVKDWMVTLKAKDRKKIEAMREAAYQ